MFESCTPESRDNIDPTVSFLGTICDISAIRRPIRLPMVTGAARCPGTGVRNFLIPKKTAMARSANAAQTAKYARLFDRERDADLAAASCGGVICSFASGPLVCTGAIKR
jgi:hypothetical protein